MKSISNKDSLVIVPEIKSLLMKTNKSKKLYGQEIVDYINLHCQLESPFGQTKLRVVINHLRQQELPILSSAHGYWMSWDKREIAENIVSLKSRVTSISAAIVGLEGCIKQMDIVDEWSKKGIDI